MYPIDPKQIVTFSMIPLCLWRNQAPNWDVDHQKNMMAEPWVTKKEGDMKQHTWFGNAQNCR